jgi:hypothetical protein
MQIAAVSARRAGSRLAGSAPCRIPDLPDPVPPDPDLPDPVPPDPDLPDPDPPDPDPPDPDPPDPDLPDPDLPDPDLPDPRPARTGSRRTPVPRGSAGTPV